VRTTTGGSGSGNGPGPQYQQILDLLRSSPHPLTDVEIEQKLGILRSSVGTRLVELHEQQGVVEPIKKGKKARQTWRAVPPERQAAVKDMAAKRARRRLLASFQAKPVWSQQWLMENALRPGDKDAEVLKVPCPEVEGTGECTCPNLNVRILRHTKPTTPGKSRVRAEAARWNRERQRLLKEIEDARQAGSPLIDYHTVKLNLAEGRHYVRDAAAFLMDHREVLLLAGEASAEFWEDFTGFVIDAEEDVAALRSAFDLLAHDKGDWLDVEEVTDAELRELLPGATLDVIDVEGDEVDSEE
jgi:hypothetical protein